jgi:N utilization substance protein B
MSNRHNARRAAVQALYQWDITKQEVNEIENAFKGIHDLQNVDRKFLKKAISGVTDNLDSIEETVSQHVDRDLSTLDPVEKAILRLGTYELMFCDDVPVKVVINEMIELAKVFGSDHSYKYVNGVMDKIAAVARS